MTQQLIDDSYKSAKPVTPSDTTDIPMPSGYSHARGLYVSVSGNVKVQMADGGDMTFISLSAGVSHRIAAKRVYATGTTATGIIALF